MVTNIIFLLFTLVVFLIIYYIIKNNEAIYLNKIQLLDNTLHKNFKLSLYNYHKFFKYTNDIFEKFKPTTLSVYMYSNNDKLNIVNVKFLYQLYKENNIQTPLFADKNDIPISNTDNLIKNYFHKDLYIIKNIEELNEYDNNVYNDMRNKNIKEIYLHNIFYDNVPVGFVSLTYKTKNYLNKNSLIDLKNDIKKLSMVLNDIRPKQTINKNKLLNIKNDFKNYIKKIIAVYIVIFFIVSGISATYPTIIKDNNTSFVVDNQVYTNKNNLYYSSLNIDKNCEIKTMFFNALLNMNNGDYEQSIKILEKMLLLKNNIYLSECKINLALSYVYVNENKKAKIILNDLIITDDKYKNLAKKLLKKLK